MIALDLFAGVGWALACRELGITDRGVDNAKAVVETRHRAGLETIYNDVWDGLFGIHGVGRYQLLIASPPCQTFSPAGNGKGRKALDEVLVAIDAGLYRDPVALHGLASSLDPRTALVLAPLAHVYRDRPDYVVLEQVPPVLSVWEACAAVMRQLGYSAVTGVLNAEQYGVPQTRRRAILIARRDGIPAVMPEPTHSRYYSQDPNRLDLGVPKWISMAEALGRGHFTAHKNMGRGMVERYGDRPGRSSEEPTFTIRASAGGTEPGGFVLRPEIEAWKWKHAPATTVAGDPRITAREHHHHGEQSKTSLKLTVDEAALFQTFPAGFDWAGGKGDQFLQIGNAVPPLLGRHVLAAATAGALDLPEAVAA